MIEEKKLSHIQTVQKIRVCESGEDIKAAQQATNWNDAKYRKDKTPSVGPWQFYWGTFVENGHKYKILPRWVDTYKEAVPYMRDIVYSTAVAEAMILDGKADEWGCYKKYLASR